MVKKAKYEEYRHIIYYAAAQLELSRQQPLEAIGLYKKSLETNAIDDELKNKTFLELGNLAFSQREYLLAYNCYDSLSLESESESQTELIGNRLAILSDLLSHIENIRVEDSLQKIADMPEAERNNYLKGQVRKLRKEKGLKEEESQSSGTATGLPEITSRAKRWISLQQIAVKVNGTFIIHRSGPRELNNSFQTGVTVQIWITGEGCLPSIIRLMQFR